MIVGHRTIPVVSIMILTLTVSVRAEQHTPLPDSQDSATSSNVWTSGENLVTPPGLPELGKWMIASDGKPADWLGELYRGKSLREPINVIMVDETAGSEREAASRLLDASTAAGYPVRMGHSIGYQAYIGEQLYPQLPTGRDDAFSNEPFEISNNHGRIFGPVKVGDAYVSVAAFSREDVYAFRDPIHRYASFNQARDHFTQNLDQFTPFKVSGFVNMANAIVDHPTVTTVDHDGMAVLVRAAK